MGEYVTAVTLPNGYWTGGVCRRRVGVRALSGDDEAFLAETGAAMSLPARVSALLDRCVVAGSHEDQSFAAAALCVGDREALLLHLRRLTLGDRLNCVVQCDNGAAAGCGERMDVELSVGDLLVPPPAADSTAVHELENAGARVRFRLPTGGDQQAVAELAARHPVAAAESILLRCVESASRDALTPEVADAVAQRMSKLDPQAELTLNLSCPACGRAFSVLFDTATYFLAELTGRPEQIYEQVHRLALHYHWSEREILAMAAGRRRVYLNLLAQSLGDAQEVAI